MVDIDDPAWNLLSLHKEEADEKPRPPSSSHASSSSFPSSFSPSSLPPSSSATTSCPHCKEGEVTLIDGNLTCRACFTVVERMLDYGAEWRNYGPEDSKAADPTRCCVPASDLLPILGCIVGKARVTASRSNTIDSSGGAVAAHIQKYQSWNAMTYRERTLCAVFDVLAVNAVQHGISPCILDEAKSLYKRVADAKISRGENRVALVACSMYLACKSNKVPRSIKEIAVMFNVRPHAMTKGCRIFQQLVPLTLDTSSPPDFVRRFCSRLNIAPEGVQLAMHILERINKLNIACDSTPPSVVSGVIQMTIVELGLDISRAKLAEVCMVSPMTVTKCYKRLEEHRDELLR